VTDEEVEDEPPVKGGRAAERLREFLAARFGDDAAPIPPDEDEPEADEDEPEAKPPGLPTDDCDRES
jgi:hypothetical protein